MRLHLHRRLPGPRSPSWVFAETAASAVVSLLSLLMIGRVIGPEAAGTATVAIAAFLLLDLLGASLFTDALVQHPQLVSRHADSAVTSAVMAGSAAGLSLVAATPFLVGFANAAEVTWLALALAPLLPFSAFSGAASGLVLRQQRFWLLALRVLVGHPLALAAGLLAAAHGLGPWAMIIHQATATAVAFLVLLCLGRLGLKPRLDFGALRELWPVAGPQVAAMGIAAGKYRLFLLALGWVVAEAVLAVSHFAFRLLEAALGVVWQTVSRLAMPRLCALQHDREALAEAYGDLAQLQALLGLPLAIGVALTAPDIVLALLGPAWAGMVEATRVAALAAAVTFVYGDPVSLFVAVGKARWNLRVAAATLALPLAALAVLQPTTPAGAALCWATQSVVLAPALTWIALREINRPLTWLVRRVAPALLATAAMSTAVLLLQRGTELSSLVSAAAAAALGAAVFAAVALLALGLKPPRALVRMRYSKRLDPFPGSA